MVARKTASELAMQATVREDRLLSADASGREHLDALLAAWVRVAGVAIEELESERTVSIVNAGDQVQKHPAVTVLEAASKRVEALVVLCDRFAVPADPAGELEDDLPERWKPGAA
jgi:hypothetical protein